MRDGSESSLSRPISRCSRHGGAPIGVFELYQDYDARVTAQARKTLYPVAGFLGIAIFVLCGALVPILRRVTAAVEIRNRQLVQQASRLEQSLAAAQDAQMEAEARAAP